MRGNHLSWIRFEGGIGYISPCSAQNPPTSPLPPPQAINNEWSHILSFLSSHAILFHIRRNLRSLFHFVDITVNSWFSSFQVVLLDRLCRSQVHILLITIYFYCLFLTRYRTWNRFTWFLQWVSPPTTSLFFFRFEKWLETKWNRSGVTCLTCNDCALRSSKITDFSPISILRYSTQNF